MTVNLRHLPPCQALATSFGIGFLVNLLWLQHSGKYKVLRQPWQNWFCAGFALAASQLAYFFAFRNAPAAHVDLIYYLWPLMVVLLAALLPSEHIHLKQIAGALLGFTGIYLLVAPEAARADAGPHYLLGYASAACAALLWASYTVYSSQRAHIPPNLMGLSCGAGSLCFALAHFGFESTVVFSLREWAFLCLWGVGINGFSLSCWEYGIKHGRYQLIAVLSYGVPVASVSLLVAAGHTEASWSLAISCLLVTMGSTIAGTAQAKAEAI